MSIFTDFFVDSALYFRLGNATRDGSSVQSQLEHYSIAILPETRGIASSQARPAPALEEGRQFVAENNEEHGNNPIDLTVLDSFDSCKITHSHQVKADDRRAHCKLVPWVRKYVDFTETQTNKPDEMHSTTNSGLDGNAKPLRIVVVSDTHERQHTLGRFPACDILIHSGDILMSSSKISRGRAIAKYREFAKWLSAQMAEIKIIIGGNHDWVLEELSPEELQELFPGCHYLCNSGVYFRGLNIWGCPYSLGRSQNRAFQSNAFLHQSERAAANTGSVDILITHSPSHNIAELVNPRLLHVFGHYHSYHGVFLSKSSFPILQAAAPIMDHKYRPYNFPILIDLHTQN